MKTEENSKKIKEGYKQQAKGKKKSPKPNTHCGFGESKATHMFSSIIIFPLIESKERWKEKQKKLRYL